MTIQKKRSKWLRFSNKALSGLLFLLGFGVSREEEETGEIIPMYGMPASHYKVKKKVNKSQKKATSILKELFHLSSLKEGKDVY